MFYLKPVVLFALVNALISLGAVGQHHSMDVSQLGTVDFRTSCSPAAETHFETGLALLHHMMYEQAAEAFTASSATDPNCAMARWGIAMSQLHPLWAPPTEQEFATGHQALQKAISLVQKTPSISEPERNHILALDAYYGGENASHQARLVSWETALKQLHETYPEDVDAGAFYALAHLATAPPTDKQFVHQRQAGALLERLHERAPEHPGLFHYLIHAYDNRALAEKAVDVTHRYDAMAPNVPHALHMPSHIFVRLGMWPEVVSWNARSAESALQQPVGGHTSMHFAHAIDYQMYAYLQQGQDEKARAALEQLGALKNYQDHFASAYGVAAVQARYPLERGDWIAAAGLPVRIHADFPWDRYPHFEAITYFGRGLGASRSGDLEGARTALGKLDALHKRTAEAGEAYWAIQVDAQRKTVAAWIAYAEGQHSTALSLMEEAADLEDSVDKHPVTPGAVRPARELFGDMLALQGDHAEAINAYRIVLEVSPNRFNSLFGMGQAAEKTGQYEVATEAYTKLVEIGSEASPERREQLDRATAFLARN